ncbi:hypothetical protein WA026_015793 [Henosepilachna vigintioctopunctata]|uniref:Uncharacterized protein n=1 Tax=Henosepilachna vigintioctopunctata TaxID=420089 RepID=A0AAW1V0L9_9CUCU
MSKGEYGFRATGIFPINPYVFSDEDFLPAQVLQIDSAVGVDSVPLLPATIELERYSPIPSTSTFCLTTSQPTTDMAPTPTIQNFIQMPEKITVIKTNRGRKKQHATILTSTPLKDALVDKENKRKKKAAKNKGKGVGKKSNEDQS